MKKSTHKSKAPVVSRTATVQKMLKPKKRTLLEDDDDPPTPRTHDPLTGRELPKPKKRKSFLEDDDDEAVDVKVEVVNTPPPAVKKPAATPPPEPKLVKPLVSPPDFFNVQTAQGVRCTIVDRLSADFADLLVYNWEYHVTMHVKTSDLMPRDVVQHAIEFIKQLRSAS